MQIYGLREILNQSSDEEEDEEDSTPKSTSSPQQSGSSNFVICSVLDAADNRNPLNHPTRSQVQFLFKSFAENVDPVVKVLHVPSIRRWMMEEVHEPYCSPGPNGWDALKYAIYYTVSTSLSSEECLQWFSEDKAPLLLAMRSATESALARADFVNTEDISTLQALVLYLVGLLSHVLAGSFR